MVELRNEYIEKALAFVILDEAVVYFNEILYKCVLHIHVAICVLKCKFSSVHIREMAMHCCLALPNFIKV